jgi:hypothetical protein
MNATPVASEAGPQAGDTTVNRVIAECNAALELFRVDATLKEFEALRAPNPRLVAYYQARREQLVRELGLEEPPADDPLKLLEDDQTFGEIVEEIRAKRAAAP